MAQMAHGNMAAQDKMAAMPDCHRMMQQAWAQTLAG